MAKPFTWSFSGLTGYETCPFRYQQVSLLKVFKDVEGPELKWGNWLHKNFAGSLEKDFPLPDELAEYKKWIDSVKEGPGKLYVEQKYALTRALTPTPFFASDVWFRGIGDAVRVDGPVALVIDWKTGAVKPNSIQLMLMAQCIFSHFEEVQRVRSEFIWLKYDAQTSEVFDRQAIADAWPNLLERVNQMEHAYITQNYPPKPSGLCKRHCPVHTCKYYQKGGF